LASEVVGAGGSGEDPDAIGFTPDYSRELLVESLLKTGKADPFLIKASRP